MQLERSGQNGSAAAVCCTGPDCAEGTRSALRRRNHSRARAGRQLALPSQSVRQRYMQQLPPVSSGQRPWVRTLGRGRAWTLAASQRGTTFLCRGAQDDCPPRESVARARVPRGDVSLGTPQSAAARALHNAWASASRLCSAARIERPSLLPRRKSITTGHAASCGCREHEAARRSRIKISSSTPHYPIASRALFARESG